MGPGVFYFFLKNSDTKIWQMFPLKKKAKLVKLTLEKHIEPNFLQLLFWSQKRQNLLKSNSLVTGSWVMNHVASSQNMA
jgi:hypothetical protein